MYFCSKVGSILIDENPAIYITVPADYFVIFLRDREKGYHMPSHLEIDIMFVFPPVSKLKPSAMRRRISFL